MNATRRHLTMALATITGGAVVGGCATSMRTAGAAEWQSFAAADGTVIHYRRWNPAAKPRAIVQIVHGATEHSGRYARFAGATGGRDDLLSRADGRLAEAFLAAVAKPLGPVR
jgi:hypothetical protein